MEPISDSALQETFLQLFHLGKSLLPVCQKKLPEKFGGPTGIFTSPGNQIALLSSPDGC